MERGGPEVERVLAAERLAALGALRPLAPLQAALRAEMAAALPPSQATPAERVGGHEYWVVQSEAAPHPRYLRRQTAGGDAGATTGSSSGSTAPPQVVLDVNELAEVHGEYVSVGQVRGCSVALVGCSRTQPLATSQQLAEPSTCACPPGCMHAPYITPPIAPR